jgi:hypothetical protein
MLKCLMLLLLLFGRKRVGDCCSGGTVFNVGAGVVGHISTQARRTDRVATREGDRVVEEMAADWTLQFCPE